MVNKPNLYNFIKAFSENWFSLMGGPLAVIFTILALYVESSTQKRILIIMAILCAFSSFYKLWENERQKLVDIENQYAYALNLFDINYNLDNKQFSLKLDNKISRPLYYKVTDFEIDGVKQTLMDGILSPLSSIFIASNPYPNRFVPIKIIILYGPSDKYLIGKMTRTIKIQDGNWVQDGINKDEIIK